MTKIISTKKAAELISNNDIVTVSSSSGLGCPDAMLSAVGESFKANGYPKNLTLLHPIAAGDMYGIKGMDHLAHLGLIEAVIAGSYPSGPSSLPMPKIWEMIVNNEVAAYNVPSGIMFDLHKEAATKRPGVLTKVGLNTFVDPLHQGCAMNDKAHSRPIVNKVRFADDDWLFFPTIIPNVAILRATTADEKGNLSFEHEGAILGALDQALAVRNNGGLIIAQVKRVVASGSLNPRQVIVPCNLVDYIVVDPSQKQTTQIDYDPSISGEIKKPLSEFGLMSFSPEKIMARRAAMELKKGMAVNLGFGISANVPRILLEEKCEKEVTWVIEQGTVGGIPELGFAFGCSSNADAIIASSSQFAYFQGGGFDLTLLSFMQIDKEGNVNVSKLPSKPYLTAGCGGFVDITAHAKNIVFSGFFSVGASLSLENGELNILSQGKSKKLVNDVDHITFSGKMAIERQQNVLYITERCVIRLVPEGLMVIEIAPGVDLKKDILDEAEFPLLVSEHLQVMDSKLFRDTLINLQLKEN